MRIYILCINTAVGICHAKIMELFKLVKYIYIYYVYIYILCVYTAVGIGRAENNGIF